MSAITASGSAFWKFSLAFYDDKKVRAACLTLQDEGGADVNIVLYLLFAAEQGRALSRDEIAELDSAVAKWREEMVRPLRNLRRALEDPDFPIFGGRQRDLALLGTRIKADELAAERIQQEAMYAFGKGLAGSQASRDAAATDNLRLYGKGLAKSLPADALAVILTAHSKFRFS